MKKSADELKETIKSDKKELKDKVCNIILIKDLLHIFIIFIQIENEYTDLQIFVTSF